VAAFRALGVLDTIGLDGNWVPRDRLLFPESEFQPRDITSQLALGRTFDMCLCLEVAEHVDGRHADHLVKELVSLAPVVIFSAAIPGQTGVHHVNEQWQSYWARRFRERGYAAIDCIRPKIWDEPGVQWWYAQNMMVYVRADEHVILDAARFKTMEWPLDVVHPGMLAMVTASHDIHSRWRLGRVIRRSLTRARLGRQRPA
jgi:hypothetical protein